MLKYIIIHPADNVAVALQPLEEGESITYGSTIVKVREQVPAGHKVSFAHIAAGQDVIKYGSPIGHATETIEPGRWVNERMLRTNLKAYRITGTNPYPSHAPARLPADLLGLCTQERRSGHPQRIMDYPHRGMRQRRSERLARMLEKETRAEGIDGIRLTRIITGVRN